MGDTERGRYPGTHPLSKLLATFNGTQGNIALRSNAEWFGLANLSDQSGALASGVQTSVAVPVEYGDVITKINVLVGATAASTPTHSFAALYKGTGAAPALIGQSTDGVTAAIAASGVFTFTLASPYIVNPTDCPNGFVYASVCVTGTATPSLACVAPATAVSYQWFTGMPLKVCAVTHGSAQGATAASTIASSSAQANTPIVFLS
jgi:hypothetical protein